MVYTFDMAGPPNPFSITQWLIWFAAAIGATFGAFNFLYGTFETKDNAQVHEGFVVKRLDRIENKVDILVDGQTKEPRKSHRKRHP